MSEATLPRFYTYQQVAEVFQVHAKTLYRWFKHRPKFKYRNTVRLAESEVQRLVEERTLTRPSAALLERWNRVKRTPRPGVPVSNDARTAPKPAQTPAFRPCLST
jgi:hypothetical protein